MLFDIALTIFVIAASLWIYRLLGTVVLRAVRTGRWSMNGAIFDRAERPIMYYSAILTFSVLIAMMTAASYAMIRIWFVH
jgi:hypothetical protein